MGTAEHTYLVGPVDMLASACAEGAGLVPFPRPPREPAEKTARRLSAEGATRALLVGSGGRDELDALRDAGIEASQLPGRAPLPVSDLLYGPAEPSEGEQRVFFSGPVNRRRDLILDPVKHRFDLLHLVSGADTETLADLMARCSIAIDLRREPGLEEGDRLGPALAAGMLAVAEAPLDRDDLAPGRDLLTFSTPAELESTIEEAVARPADFLAIRRSGRAAAESWRASSMVAR